MPPGLVPGAQRLHPSTGMFADDECLTPLGSAVLFRGRSTGFGSELWRTNGTLAGTSLAIDIEPGEGSSTPSCGAVIGTRMLFTADQAGRGREYWLSDGTFGGTVPLDVRPGPLSGAPAYTDNRDYQVAAGSWAAFAADDGIHGFEPWATDGTPGGTFMLRDVHPGASGSSPFIFRAVGERVYFSADDGLHGRELWTSDGTLGGTRLVTDIVPGGEGSDPNARNTGLGLLFFTARYKLPGAATPPRLYFRTDGTSGGTLRLGDWDASPGQVFRGLDFFSFCSGCSDLAGQNGGLWATDGTPTGTGPVVTPLRVLAPLVVARGRLFFMGHDALHGFELWSSDGTAAGTRLVHDTRPGPESSYAYELTPAGDLVAFEGNDLVRGAEPWLSDGTAAGTRLAADVVPGPENSSPRGFTVHGGRVYFVARDALWVLTETLSPSR
jgi:ELWxxDGT repeat protein